MTILFITGLSGVGKSSALSEMSKRGFRTVDLDAGYMRYQDSERLFDEARVKRLLEQHQESHLILAGTESSQGQFYPAFDEVILFTADLETMLDRIEKRQTNPYGKTKKERQEIINSYKHVLPLLKKGASVLIDTTHVDIQEVCDQLEALL